jgi:hypothetical protein
MPESAQSSRGVGGIVAGVVLVVAVVFFSAISCGLVFKGPLRLGR